MYDFPNSQEGENEPNHPLKPLRDDAMQRLEWPRVATALASFAVFRSTQERLESIEPQALPAERNWWLQTTAEMGACISAQDPPVALQPLDPESFLPLLRRKSILSATLLFECLVLTRLAAEATAFVKTERHKQRDALYPSLVNLLEPIKPQPRLHAALARSIDADGMILSSASEELRQARARLESARKRIVDQLEGLLRKSSVRDACQDPVWMIRDGRYVLPVRSDRRSDVSGAPRGVSQSGATLFIEPHELAQAHTNLEVSASDVQLEEARILRDLSNMAHEVQAELQEAATQLSLFDELTARTRLAQAIGGVRPEFHSDSASLPRFVLREARHPLYALENKLCVANDLVLSPPEVGSSQVSVGMPPPPCIWVLSGPNAGGKTVAMRTVGCLAMMAKAGLFVSAREAIFYEFDEVFVELGDRQSRAEDLSTFSGHLLHLKKITDNVTENSLVLLDEGFVGTDPGIGQAMARSTLEFLASRNATVIITTHFSSLKLIADSDPRFLNASMEFEGSRLRPTYALLNGVPGQSYALELAARLGFQEDILSRASTYHGEEARRMERLLAELQNKRTALQEELLAQTKLRETLERELVAVRQERQSTQALRDGLVDGYRDKLQKRLNAFTNRLEIRERQFEKHKNELLREVRDVRESEHSQGAESASSLSPNSVRAGTLQPEATRPNQARNHEQGGGRKSSAPREPAKPVALTDFAALANVRLKANQQASAQSAEEDDLDTKAARFRAPQKMTSRDLLDEAHESLEILKRTYDRIERNLTADVSTLAELEGQTHKQVEKSVAQAKSQQPAKHGPEYWQPRKKIKTSKFKETGEVIKAADAKGMVECLFGILKVRLHHTDLMTPGNTPARTGPSANMSASESLPNRSQAQAMTKAMAKANAHTPSSPKGRNALNMDIEPTFQFSGNTLDLRGRMVEDALEKLESFLDRAWRENQPTVIIIHGHGTGKVKQAVREFLVGTSYALTFRPGTQGEGGDGATVVRFEV